MTRVDEIGSAIGTTEAVVMVLGGSVEEVWSSWDSTMSCGSPAWCVSLAWGSRVGPCIARQFRNLTPQRPEKTGEGTEAVPRNINQYLELST